MTTAIKTNSPSTAARQVLDKAFNSKSILEIVEDAAVNHGFISIRGYAAKSGGKSNYIVQPLGPHGYETLLGKSVEWMKTVEKPAECYGIEIDNIVWAQALLEQKESWQKSLDGEQVKRKNPYTEVSKGFYLNEHAPDDSVTIRNIVVVSVDVIEAKTESEKAKKMPKSALAAAKKYLRDNGPAGKYRGTFVIEPGRFEAVRFSGNEIEG